MQIRNLITNRSDVFVGTIGRQIGFAAEQAPRIPDTRAFHLHRSIHINRVSSLLLRA